MKAWNLQRRKRNAKILVAFSICIMISVTLLLVFDIHYMGVGWVSDNGGLWYISERYTPNDNVSYTVTFHSINYTFMYWTYPGEIQDADYTVYFSIEFADNSSTVLGILTGSSLFTTQPSTRPLVSKTTIGTSPIVGVLYHGYLDNPCSWRFIVSLF